MAKGFRSANAPIEEEFKKVGVVLCMRLCMYVCVCLCTLAFVFVDIFVYLR